MEIGHVFVRLDDGSEVIRYENAGKWYHEKLDGSRQLIGLGEAVELAKSNESDEIFLGQPGGRHFDKRLREWDSRLADA